MNFPARVAAKAQSVSLVKVLLTVLAFPFYVVGFVAGVVWVALLWAYSGVALGVADVKAKGSPDAG